MKTAKTTLILLSSLLGGFFGPAEPVAAEVDHDGETPVIVVDNDGQRYTRVRTTELEYVVAIRVNLPKGATPSGGTVSVGRRASLPQLDGSRGIDINAGGGWNLTKLRFPYSPPRNFDGRELLDPVAVCNQNLDAKTDSAKDQMRQDGLRVMLPAAYPVKVVVGYWEKKRLGIRNDGSKALEGTYPVWLECAPLVGPKVRTKTSTTGSGGPRAKRLRDINPMGDFSFSVTPVDKQQIDGRYCPLSIRLAGTVESVNPFSGHATFFGSDYVSPPLPLELGRSHSQQVAASIPLDWSKASKSFTHSRPRGRNSREFRLQMQIADSTGRVLGTTEKRIFTVTCDPIRGGGSASTEDDTDPGADSPPASESEGSPEVLVRGVRPRTANSLEVFVRSLGAAATGCTLEADITSEASTTSQSINVSQVAASVTVPVLVNLDTPLTEIESAVFTLHCPDDRSEDDNVGYWPHAQED